MNSFEDSLKPNIQSYLTHTWKSTSFSLVLYQTAWHIEKTGSLRRYKLHGDKFNNFQTIHWNFIKSLAIQSVFNWRSSTALRYLHGLDTWSIIWLLHDCCVKLQYWLYFTTVYTRSVKASVLVQVPVEHCKLCQETFYNNERSKSWALWDEWETYYAGMNIFSDY